MEFYNLSSAYELRQSMLKADANESSASGIKMSDCTVFSRVGFRGKGVEAFLVTQGLPVPAKPNQSVVSESGVIVLRLSNTEFWIIDADNTQHTLIKTLELASQNMVGVYRLYCQHSHSSFLIKGADISTMFAKICGVDLSDDVFPIGNIAQTSVARTSTIVVRQMLKGETVFIMFSDLAGSQYLWDAIADASAEFIEN
jgi:sarcosine oxidase subunit gamma